MNCRLCNNNIQKVIDLSDIVPFSVMSDNRIIQDSIIVYLCKDCSLLQKDSSQAQQDNYFKEFKSHQLSDGEEQLKPYNNELYPRSEIIIKLLSPNISERGKILDVGTGNGAFLKNFKKLYPFWSLHAQDLQDNSKDSILKIIPSNNFIHGDIGNITEKFNIIAVNHVLNHIVDLELFLDNIQNLLEKDGQLIIQVPYILDSISDLVIIESINHFSKKSIYTFLKKYFENITISDTISGELTILASNNKKQKDFFLEEDSAKIFMIIENFKKLIHRLISNRDDLIVFGTSPLGNFCASIIQNHLHSLIDEDPNKIGKKILGKDILHPKDANDKKLVLLPFFDKRVISHIKQRYYNFNYIDVFEL